MKAVLVVTADETLRARLLRPFADWSVFVAPNDREALGTLQLADIDLVLRDCTSQRDLPGFVSRLRELGSAALVVAIGADGEDAEAADLVLAPDFAPRELEAIVRQGLDKRRLVQEVALLRRQEEPLALVERPLPAPAGPDGAVLARVLHELSRLFAASFDLPRMLEMFVDAVGELLRPTRAALLLPDEAGDAYRVVVHRGLVPKIVESLRFPADEGLCRWLVIQGRPARLSEMTDPEILRELRLLQGVVAVPLLTHGELVAILVVGQPVSGGSHGRHETEILFDLATHLAAAIRETTLHAQLRREKEFSERILAHMASGVVTIGRDERVGLINRRAEQILGLAADDVLHRDLRVLPSPLGDMLFQTLSTGEAMPRAEIQLALNRLWLEVSTYPIRGEEPAPLGAVLVFEDLTAQKELEARKQQAEEFQLLSRVIARIADEIKNPLVSINTFVELIEERYDDADFRKAFSSVVRRDVRRLVQVFEKLAGLVSEGELHFVEVDVREVVDQLATAVESSEDGVGKILKLDVEHSDGPQVVRADPGHLRRALSYLVWYLTANTRGDHARVVLSVGRVADGSGAGRVRILVSSKTAAIAPDQITRLFDPVYMVQESLIDVGPAVSQRLIEAQGGALTFRHGRSDVAFEVTLPLIAA
ncbi:MAG: GAF domain-containing protein [Candidatus Rokubacteria bacterium]|nr:GAF domain-containing protein [Candidatus Rokubacteria bacterium]